MPSFFGQGQSELATEAKVRGLSYALAINLRIYAAKFAASRYRYWHFDLNAGSGFNDKVGCVGSPLTFLAQADASKIGRYFAGFCDCDEDAVRLLRARPEVSSNPSAFIFHGDNGALCDAIPHIIAASERPEFALGTVISDDNATGVPVAQLAKLAQTCPRLDIVIHWNSTAFKRVLRRYPEHTMLSLPDAIEAIPKPFWWIREPVSAHGFTLLIGRGKLIQAPAALGFHILGSHKGQQILQRCSQTTEELRAMGPAQGGLF
jgi:hypothetical protein